MNHIVRGFPPTRPWTWGGQPPRSLWVFIIEIWYNPPAVQISHARRLRRARSGGPEISRDPVRLRRKRTISVFAV